MGQLKPKTKLGKYGLIKRLGVGGDGEVWLATTPENEHVALKARVKSKNSSNFLREFERLRLMRLPSIINVHEAGQDKGFVFYTMDIANGQDLLSYANSASTSSSRVNHVIHATKDIALALSSMHRIGLAHLDLKPDNIIVKDSGKAVLLDFGRACALGERQTMDSIAGTMKYMSPEQRIGLPSDHKSDCYSLGVTLYETLSEGAEMGQIGRPWRSLATMNPYIPLALSALVDQLLRLDPQQRPSAESVYRVLLSLEKGYLLNPPTWPSPVEFVGEAKSLLHRSLIVVGVPGSGKRRIINEARALWHMQGYRSISGKCSPFQPYGLLKQLIHGLLSPMSPKMRRQLLGSQASIIKSIAPKAPIPTESSERETNPKIIAAALSKVLKKAAPIALVCLHIDRMDRASLQVMMQLSQSIPEGVKIWGTSNKKISWLPMTSPPSWGPIQEKSAMKSLLPPDIKLPKGRAKTPLYSCVKAWVALAKWRKEAGPTPDKLDSIRGLGVLEQPFPKLVGDAITNNFEQLIKEGLVKGYRQSDRSVWYRVADQGNLLLLKQRDESPQTHRLAAQAWQRIPDPKLRAEKISKHRVLAGDTPVKAILSTIYYAVEKEDFALAQQWLQYLEAAQIQIETNFNLLFSKGLVALKLQPGKITPSQFQAISNSAVTEIEMAKVRFLEVAMLAKDGIGDIALRKGASLVGDLSSILPEYAIETLRIMALCHLEKNRLEEALKSCNDAELLIASLERTLAGKNQERLQSKALTLRQTYSAALIFNLKLIQACQLCEEAEQNAKRLGFHFEKVAIYINWSIALIRRGERGQASDVIIRCRRMLEKQEQPTVTAWCALIEAQLAIERGEVDTGLYKLDEALALGEALDLKDLLGLAWTLLLEAAVQKGSPREAKRAISGQKRLGSPGPQSHWKGALAKWKWMTGDVVEALRLCEKAPKGYAGARIQAERCRLLLISGQIEKSVRAARKLKTHTLEWGMSEIAIFADLIIAAGSKVDDRHVESLLNKCKKREWTELYLGSLHLNAIRRRLRGQNISSDLLGLRERADALQHRLYSALGQEDSW